MQLYSRSVFHNFFIVFMLISSSTKAEVNEHETSETLNFGCTADLSRNVSMISVSVTQGIELAFDAINAKDGVHGKKLNFIKLDDQYSPEKAIENANRLLNDDKIDTFLSPGGSLTLQAYINLIKAEKILVLFPSTNSEQFRSPSLKYFIHFGVSYEEELELLVKYALKNLRSKKIAVFYQSGLFTPEKFALIFKKLDLPDYLASEYQSQSLNFDNQIKALKNFAPDTIIFLAIPMAALEFIRQAGVEFLSSKHLLGWADLITDDFRKAIKERGLKLIHSSSVPNPQTKSLPIAEKFMENISGKGIVPNVFNFKGYINASMLIEILKKIDGTITKEKIISTAEQLKNFDLGGILLTFNPAKRTLSSSIWIDDGEKEWKKISLEDSK